MRPVGTGIVLSLMMGMSHGCSSSSEGLRPPEPAHAEASLGTGDLVVRVQDEEGHPISGAFLLSDPKSISHGPESDLQGLTTLANWDRKDVYVVAPHFRVQRIRPSGESRDPRVVTLPRANRLELHIRTVDGRPLTEATALIGTEAMPLFVESDSATLGGWRQQLFMTGHAYAATPHCLAVHPTPEGRIVFEDVQPGRKIDIEIVDGAMTPLLPATSVEVGAAESASVERIVDGELVELLVRVQDETGSAVEDARVRVLAWTRPRGEFDSMELTKRTGGDGICRLSGVRPTDASVTVRKRGYEPWYLGAISIGSSSNEVACTLKRSAQ